MIKKIWIWLLSLFVIFWFWFTFANPIAIDFDDMPKVCYKLKNVEIGDYKVIIEYGEKDSYYGRWGRPYDLVISGNERELYEAKKNECTKCGWGSSKVYLIDKNMDIKDITQENIDSKAILVWKINNSDCESRYDKIETYKLTNNWDSYEIVSGTTKDLEKIRKFPLIRLFAVIIETIALFLLVKSFQRKDEIKEGIWYESNKISNKRLLLWGIIPTTVTLPFLWFVLPLLLWDWWLYIVVWEILVATIEAVMIKYWLNISWKRAIIASIVCNICSFVVLWIYALLDSYPYLIRRAIPRIIMRSLGVIIFELTTLFVVGKLSKEWVSNKRLVLSWIITPIIDIVVTILIARMLEDRLYISEEWIITIVIIVIKLLVDMFIIKCLRKISWRKAIIASIFFNLCLVAIILALVRFLG